MITGVSKNRDCSTCNKLTVCKYSEAVSEKVEHIINELSAMELPLIGSVSCKEWDEKTTITLR